MAEEVLPDLIICDINMPKMDGLTMLSKMRAEKWGENLSVIMLTNYSDQKKYPWLWKTPSLPIWLKVIVIYRKS